MRPAGRRTRCRARRARAPPRSRLPALRSARAQAEADVLGDGQVREERTLLGDVADAAPLGRDVRRRTRRRRPCRRSRSRPPSSRDEADDRAQQRRLAAARGAEDRGERALRHVEVDVGEDGALPVGLREPRCSEARPSSVLPEPADPAEAAHRARRRRSSRGRRGPPERRGGRERHRASCSPRTRCRACTCPAAAAPARSRDRRGRTRRRARRRPPGRGARAAASRARRSAAARARATRAESSSAGSISPSVLRSATSGERQKQHRLGEHDAGRRSRTGPERVARRIGERDRPRRARAARTRGTRSARATRHRPARSAAPRGSATGSARTIVSERRSHSEQDRGERRGPQVVQVRARSRLDALREPVDEHPEGDADADRDEQRHARQAPSGVARPSRCRTAARRDRALTLRVVDACREAAPRRTRIEHAEHDRDERERRRSRRAEAELVLGVESRS